jgi:ferritin
MLAKKIEEALNVQLELEAVSSQHYLAMASWAENQGFEGVSGFLYKHSDEERTHMLKVLKFINERGGVAIIPALPLPEMDYKNIQEVFEQLFEHETMITNAINELVFLCLENKDYTTHNFLQWYVAEQLEEEALARGILDKLKLIGNDKGGLYLFDRDLISYTADSVANVPAQ